MRSVVHANRYVVLNHVSEKPHDDAYVCWAVHASREVVLNHAKQNLQECMWISASKAHLSAMATICCKSVSKCKDSRGRRARRARQAQDASKIL